MSIIIKLVFCVVTWIQSHSYENHEVCGLEYHNPRKRAVGDRSVRYCQFSWTVSIATKGGDRSYSGTFLDDRHVIMNAKPLYPRSSQVPLTPENVRVNYETHQPMPNWTTPVSDIFIHDNYNLSTDDNIAILRLNESITFGTCPRPVCLLSEAMQSYDAQNKTCIAITIHTDKKKDGVRFRHTKWVDQPIATEANCTNFYGPTVATNKTFCAGGQGQDICAGDGGGAIMCEQDDGRYYLYGLVNIARDQDCGRNYTLYTNVSSYLTWINNTINAQ